MNIAESAIRTMVFPLWPREDNDGVELPLDARRWWEAERVLLITSVQGGEHVDVCVYDRDDDQENAETPADYLPLGIESRIQHHVEGEDYPRSFTLDRLLRLPLGRVPGLTNAIADAYQWAQATGEPAS